MVHKLEQVPQQLICGAIVRNGCDYPDCSIQQFHLKCLNLSISQIPIRDWHTIQIVGRSFQEDARVEQRSDIEYCVLTVFLIDYAIIMLLIKRKSLLHSFACEVKSTISST